MAVENTSGMTPEAAAYLLFKMIAAEEASATGSPPTAQVREYYLDLYSDCLHVAKKGFYRKRRDQEGDGKPTDYLKD